MYEQFTDRARLVIRYAHQEAERCNHEYIGTEHILLGIVQEGTGVAASVLMNLGVDLKEIRIEVEKLVQSGADIISLGKLPQTPRARMVIECAIDQSRSLGHDYVGTEHLLLGLMGVQEAVAAQVLANLGLGLEQVRGQVLNLLGHHGGGAGKEAMERSPRSAEAAFDPTEINRPDRALMKYYVVISLLTGPLFPITVLPLWFKYETLKYRFDQTGVSMSWGILWRREIHLTYRRIQDIHLTRNIIQRWMRLATVGIQTASGSSGPEMSIEGILQANQLRDYLYVQMRGARGDTEAKSTLGRPSGEATEPPAEGDEALSLLREIRDLLRRLAARQGEES